MDDKRLKDASEGAILIVCLWQLTSNTLRLRTGAISSPADYTTISQQME